MRMKNIITLLTLFLLTVACQPGRDSENDYVDFLYQHMALPESTDYPRQYYEQQVAQALQARILDELAGEVALRPLER